MSRPRAVDFDTETDEDYRSLVTELRAEADRRQAETLARVRASTHVCDCGRCPAGKKP